MNDHLLRVYHHLPGAARNIAASLHGYRLRRWRYGPDTEDLVQAALARERWSAQATKAWQEERLGYVLERAATRVPYYRDYWAERRRRGDAASWRDLANWQILEKEAVRRDPRRFVADDCDIRKMYMEHTSGSTGKPLVLWWTRETVRRWYAFFEARCRRWHEVSLQDRWAILGGQLICPFDQKRPPFWVWNTAFRQLYLSSYHLSPERLPYYLDAIDRFGVRYVYGYPAAIAALAREAVRLGWRKRTLQVALGAGEPVYPDQRDIVRAAFGGPLRETYGMSEIVAAATECPSGRLHLWPEVGWIEVLDDGRPVSPGQAGELICTGLFNADMPLIRYRVGDRGALRAPDATCPCGRELPLLVGLDGRTDDVLFSRDGRSLCRLDPVFKCDLPIAEAQIIQEDLDTVRVLYVPAAGFGSSAADAIVRRLRERVGEVKVILESVDAIPRGANGKFRAVICRLPAEQRAPRAVEVSR